MTDSDALELRWPHVVTRVLFRGILAAALYFLSIGPAYWLLLGRSALDTERTLRFYTPVFQIAEVAPVSGVFGSYCSWWAELPGGTVERMLHGARN